MQAPTTPADGVNVRVEAVIAKLNEMLSQANGELAAARAGIDALLAEREHLIEVVSAKRGEIDDLKQLIVNLRGDDDEVPAVEPSRD